MRQIELKGKVYGNTRQTVDALAWATNRRGRNTWKSDSNVVQVIFKYLQEHNVALPGADNTHGGSYNVLRNAIKRLAAEGFAEIAQAKAGAPLTMFKFKDDVDLNGHLPRFKTENPPAEDKSEGRTVAVGQSRVVDPFPAPVDMEDLLPAGPKPERYLEANIDAILDVWAEKDPEGYAKWAETLIERLGAIYG